MPAEVVRWVARHPRYHPHFTPTSGALVNQVGPWFREIAEKWIDRGSFTTAAVGRSHVCFHSYAYDTIAFYGALVQPQTHVARWCAWLGDHSRGVLSPQQFARDNGTARRRDYWTMGLRD